MKNLLNEWNEISLDKIFEIEVNGEYYIYYINADEQGLYAGGCSNIGFMPYKGLFIEWDYYSNIDQHLQEIYQLCYEYSLKGEA